MENLEASQPQYNPVFDNVEQPPAEIENPSRVDRKMQRWIVFTGNVLLSHFTRHYAGMQMGGENLGQNYKTLVKTKGVLRRCELVPMQQTRDWRNPDDLGASWDAEKFENTVPSGINSNLPYDRTGNHQGESVYGILVYPGDELAGLFQLQQGEMDSGIREIEQMRGMANEEVHALNIQRNLFPAWDMYLAGAKQMPETVSALENHLRARKKAIGEPLYDEIIDTMLESAAQFRRWGTAYLDKMSRLVKAAPSEGGQTYSWSPLAMLLFDQLELNKEEFLMSKKAAVPEQVVSAAEMSEMRETMKAMMELNMRLAKNELERQEASAPAAVIGEKVSFSITEAVIANGREGIVVKKNFGNYKVKFPDETEETFKADQLAKTESIN